MVGDEDFLKELQEDFLSEASFLMEQYEEYFLQLDDPQADRGNLLNEIFRVAHSIKGAAAATEFHDLSGFAHCVEDFLSTLRAAPERLDREGISLLLEAGDALRTRIAQLKEHSDAPWDTEALTARLREMTAAKTAPPAPVAPESPGKGEKAPPQAPEAVASPPSPEGSPVAVHSAPPSPERAAEAGSAQPPAAPARGEKSSPSRATGTPGPRTEKIKVDAERVEEVLNLVGELVILKSQLLHEERRTKLGPTASNAVRMLEKTVRELYDKTLAMRLTALQPLYLKAQRTVRDAALRLGKKAEFVGQGSETEVDRTIVDALGDPVVHLIRNAVDHGLESPEERRVLGKNETGRISLSARQKGSQVIIEIHDDGRGISSERIIQRAVEQGLLPTAAHAASLTPAQVYDFMFHPGFSTARQVTDLSGRGVGLDVVKASIEKMEGTVEIDSRPGEGSTFRLTLPLTTAISDGMVVRVNGYPYIIPVHCIREISSAREAAVTQVLHSRKVIALRDHFIPLVDLSEALRVRHPRQSASPPAAAAFMAEQDSKGERMTFVITMSRGIPIALAVDGVVGQSQFVIRPLPPEFREIRGLSGSAVLGDGRIALVLDVDALHPAGRPQKIPQEEPLTAA